MHVVADGTVPTDAVNVRQLDAGLARSVAISGLPQIRAGKNNAFGVAFDMNGEEHGEVALDGDGKNSPFVEALVKRTEQKPPIEVRRLFDFIRKDVFEGTNKQQQPFSYGSLEPTEDFYFTN